MEQHQGKMSDVLCGIRDAINRYRSNFGSLMPDFVKVGFLGQSPIFPAISVVPSNQVIVEQRANRCYIIAREVAIQIYDSDVSRGTAAAKLQRNVDTMNTLLRNYREHFLRDSNERKTSFTFDWGQQIMPAEPANLPSGAFVMEAILMFTFYSKWWRPLQANSKPVKYSRLSDEDCFSRVFTFLDAQRAGGKLSRIERLASGEGVLRGTGINASLRVGARTPERYGAALDMDNLQYEMIFWNRMLPDEESLIQNSDVAEAAWELIDEDESFNGAFYDTNMNSIQWRERQGNKTDPPYYETILAFTAQKPALTLEGTQ